MTNVLVVEDNVDLANLIRSLLQFEKYAVDVFHSGDEGLANILVNPYDLVILDWNLPGVSGLEILSQFRQRGARTPVIMLTGKDTVADKEAGLDGGADDYITKPFNLKELGARVRAHLRRASISATKEISLADISLDCVNQRAIKGGRTHVLTALEFQLLEFAARYPHIQPSGEDLLGSILANEVDKSEQKLRMAIRRLRKKLDPAGAIIFPHIFAEATQAANLPLGEEDAPDPDVKSDPLVGTILNGKYELLELIGGGGSGLVYLGKHLVLDNIVALKVLYASTLPQSDMARRFYREAKLTAHLTHANIVMVRDFGIAEMGQPYLVMELVEGASLAEVLEQQHRLPVLAAINFFLQACAGLEHAHSKGIVHRDIKPSNLMLVGNSSADDVTVKIVDFGMARPVQVEQGAAKITQTGHILGSPPYMSPEQCRGERVDSRSDIYSIGCALFETIEGRPPFSGTDPVQIFIKHITEKPPAVSQWHNAPAHVSSAWQNRLKEIVAKCLGKEPESRYQSAAALMEALTELRADQTTETTTDKQLTVSMLAPLPVPEAPAEPGAESNEHSWAERKKSSLAWLVHHLH